MEAAERYKYLWDGSEPGWVLIRMNRETTLLTVEFQSDSPSPSEIKTLREVVPSFRCLSATEAFTRLRGTKFSEIGEFESREAQQITKACRLRGMKLLERVIDHSDYLPFNENRKSGLIIDDNELCKKVCELAIRNGVPVKHIEA